jgi:hypothetical protein
MADLTLGALVDPAAHQRTDQAVVLPSSDLTTHGVIVGMTGSGKTGLGIVLIEECLSGGIPCLLIDPKGDLANLLLMFPELTGAEFRPWINEGDAQKAGVSPDEFAEQQAATWKDGLAGWGIGPDRIRSVRDGVRATIYTPGSTAGEPVNLVGSLQAPADTSDVETMRDEIEGFVSGILGLVGIEADPLASREFILLANLIETAWTQGRSLDLAALVGQVQQPPLRKLGVFELDTFFPPADRTAFALRLNGLLASPAFAAWAAGAPLDVDSLLHAPNGRPCAAIVSIAHLSDEERQFVTALLLSKVVTWMRRQSGTTDLRALVYMDEVAGYVPPTANPPTKKPIMTLMKQARAFGVGMVLSTQNPVDLDYKAISNAGMWMVGRLQTERDKARLLEGMSAAAGTVDVGSVSDTISGLGKREFVLKRAGKDAPEVFTTRWAMSYLRGPLTRDQIASLTVAEAAAATPSAPAAASAAEAAATRPAEAVATASQPTPAPAEPGATAAASTPAASAPAASTSAAPAAAVPLADDETPIQPKVAAGVPVRWLDPAAGWAAQVGALAGSTRFAAAAVARVHLRFDEEKAGLVHDEEWETVLFPLEAHPDPAASVAVDYDDRDLLDQAPAVATYQLPGAPIESKTFWSGVQRDLVDWLVRNRTLQVATNPTLKLFARIGEDEVAFAARCQEAGQARADEASAKLQDKYRTKAQAIEAKMAAQHEKASIAAAKIEAMNADNTTGLLTSLVGSFLGGRRRTRSLARGRSTAADSARLQSANQRLVGLQADVAELDQELQQELATIDAEWDARAADVRPLDVRLEKADVSVDQLALVWIPLG